jgi:hypothetical protein
MNCTHCENGPCSGGRQGRGCKASDKATRDVVAGLGLWLAALLFSVGAAGVVFWLNP